MNYPPLKYATVCSGIEAPSSAWHSLGWQPVWFSEIEPFPCKVLKHHYPQVPNLGDMTKLNEHEIYRESTIDLFCGGTPCQSFSIAGLRGGLDDGRGNLALEYCRILIAKRPRWFVWENVPGVFSSNGGKDFACILSAFTGKEINAEGLGNTGVIEGEFYSVAWRVLDAQYFGVPQRRRRVFVIGYLGKDWRPPFAVLFERDSLRLDFEASAKERKGTTGKAEGNIDCTEHGISATVTSKWAKGNGGPAGDEHYNLVVSETIDFRNDKTNNESSGTLQSKSNGGQSLNYVNPVVTYSLQGSMLGREDKNGPQGSGLNDEVSFTLNKTYKHAVVYDTTQITSPQNGSNPQPELCHSLAKGQHVPLVTLSESFQQNADGELRTADISFTLNKNSNASGRNCPLLIDTPEVVACEQADTITIGANQTTGRPGDIAAINAIARRLTPLECERLQGFPDNHTAIPGAKDGPRYAAIGNSMAVPVMKWIGERIAMMDKIMRELKASKP